MCKTMLKKMVETELNEMNLLVIKRFGHESEAAIAVNKFTEQTAELILMLEDYTTIKVMLMEVRHALKKFIEAY